MSRAPPPTRRASRSPGTGRHGVRHATSSSSARTAPRRYGLSGDCAGPTATAATRRLPMRNSLGYVVVTFNQASHQPGLNTGADLHSQLEDAVNARDWEREE